MPTAERTFTVTPSPEVVLDYLKDFAHAEQWDPGTEKCLQNGTGPIEVGTSWHNESKVAGNTTELTYTLTELTTDRVVFVGENATVRTTDTISVTPAGEGSQSITTPTCSCRAPQSSPRQWRSWAWRNSVTTPRSN